LRPGVRRAAPGRRSVDRGLTEQPRLYYMHYWAVDDAVILAKALRPALDATNLQSP
jgi:Domain of Unknown Function (DUF1259)